MLLVRPAGREDALFRNSGCKVKVRKCTALRWSAIDDALWLLCYALQ